MTQTPHFCENLTSPNFWRAHAMNWPNFFTRCLYCRYKGPLQFSWFLADIKVTRTTHEFRDFELSCEKHIMALASTKTGTYLSSSSGPSGPRTRMFRPLSGPSGPRVTVPFFFWWQHCRGRLPAPWYIYHHFFHFVFDSSSTSFKINFQDFAPLKSPNTGV